MNEAARDPHPPAGRHCILELYGCGRERLNDLEFTRAALRDAAAQAGTTLLREVVHPFEPQGVTGLALLAESHLSIHTWPDYGYAAVDLFTCGDSTAPEEACRLLIERYAPESYSLQTLHRGFPARREG